MKTAAKPALGDTQTIHMLPRWVTSAQSQDTDSVVFLSGAALAMVLPCCWRRIVKDWHTLGHTAISAV